MEKSLSPLLRARGVVVLLVDVPRYRVQEIEALISHHREASIGGIG